MSLDSDRSQRLEDGSGYLPWMIAGAVLSFGGAKVEALRPQLAVAIALAVPVVLATSGVFRLRGAPPALETCALVLGGAVVIAAELGVAGGFLGMTRLAGALPAARMALVALPLPALLLHTLAAREGLNSRFGAWIGMACAFAWYVSSSTAPDRFAGVFTAFFFALGVGGGLGLFVGEGLRRWVQPA